MKRNSFDLTNRLWTKWFFKGN